MVRIGSLADDVAALRDIADASTHHLNLRAPSDIPRCTTRTHHAGAWGLNHVRTAPRIS